jgi:aspartyl-tRNA(Asn)/glutamyl-tRNA(Gln) amidotransferase subunit A
LGKTNLDEFAMGSSTEHSAFKITKNPKDLSRVPGGSSGGSAAALAGEECLYSLGSDTGGSVRQPASFCGVVGLKPTYGAVSRYGLIAMASSLDQIGPITKTVEDARIVFDVISGRDEMDSTNVDKNFQFSISNFQSSSNFQFSNLKIGVPKEYFVKGIDAEVEAIIKKAIKKLDDAGAEIDEITLPHTSYALACYYIIMCAEVSANLARYDGIKYGFSKKATQNLSDVYSESRGEGFGQEAKRRIMLGTFALSAGYYDAYYLRAQKVRSLIKQDFASNLEKIDLILTPTAPTPAFKIGERLDDPLTMYLSDIFTVSANLAGLPAISFPAGQTKEGLPVGLQLIGQRFEEELLLKVAELFEKL